MDREAWWEDIVALLEEDLDQPEATVANVQMEDKKPEDKPQQACLLYTSPSPRD